MRMRVDGLQVLVPKEPKVRLEEFQAQIVLGWLTLRYNADELTKTFQALRDGLPADEIVGPQLYYEHLVIDQIPGGPKTCPPPAPPNRFCGTMEIKINNETPLNGRVFKLHWSTEVRCKSGAHKDRTRRGVDLVLYTTIRGKLLGALRGRFEECVELLSNVLNIMHKPEWMEITTPLNGTVKLRK